MEYFVVNGSEKQLHDLEYMFPEDQFTLVGNATGESVSIRFREKDKNGIKQEIEYPIEKWSKRLNLVEQKSNARKIAIWGTGEAGLITTSKWKDFYPDLEIYCYLDSFPKEKNFQGKKVYKPEECGDFSEYYIVIANEKAFSVLRTYLESQGLREEEDYIGYKTAFAPISKRFIQTFYDEVKTNKVCRRPFGYTDVINNDIYLCCPASTKFTSVGTIAEQSFETIWHGELAKLYRLSVVNGTYSFCDPDFCDKCKLWGRESYRYNKNAYELVEEEYPDDMMLGLDDSCNLCCPSCRNELWIDSDEEHITKKIEHTRRVLGNAIANVEHLWLAGAGEVFVSRIYKAVMRDMTKTRDSISVLSNGILFQKENWNQYLASYKKVHLIFSMDGATKETYEKLRRGGIYEKMMSNIKFAGKLRKDGKIQKFQINLVLQADNVKELPLFIELAKKHHIDRIHIIKLFDYHIKSEEEMEHVIIVDERTKGIREKYKKYFTKEILMNPLIDWAYMANYVKEDYKLSIFESETSLF